MENKPDPNLHERRVFGLRLPKPSHPDLRQLRDQHAPSVQGHKTWNATWLLLDFLRSQDLSSDLRVLDVGCGWGLAGIFCASQCRARVTAVDVDRQVFPFLLLHARLNQVEIRTLEASFDGIATQLLRQHDLLIGADICFREDMVEPLYQLCTRALAAGVGRVLLVDPGRSAFRQFAARCAQTLGGVEQEWTTDEPLLSWPGAPVPIRGWLLIIDGRYTGRNASP